MSNEIKVLDHGFVRLVDSMGNDAAICEAARVSYGPKMLNISADPKKQILIPEVTDKQKEDDRKLIRYLMSHKHTSPFEMVEFKFHCKMPIFVARQWIRHRTANVNEMSGRYSVLKDEWYVPELNQIKAQSKSNKQGREGEVDKFIEEDFRSDTLVTGEQLFDQYHKHLEGDISRELARINLPLATYTEWYWKIDLHNLFHFLMLRLDEHAQWEIRQYAQVMYEMIKPIVPVSCEAFEDYVLNAKTFSAQEIEAIRQYLRMEATLFDDIPWKGLSQRESDEFKKKLGLIPEATEGK